jgi:proteasome lid subunit RPN8/RPN11
MQTQIAEEALAAFPRECCGLLEGRRDGEAVEVTVLHPSPNLAQDPDRFEIDPALQFRLMREGRDVVGCYHSHPNGVAEPSTRDTDFAAEQEFVWLIAALDGRKVRALVAHIREGGGWRKLTLCD